MINLSLIGITLVLLISLISLTIGQNITKVPCTTPDMEKGICIHLDQCIYLLNMMMQKPLPVADRDFLKNSQCSFTNGKVFVCCLEDKIDVQIWSIFNTRETKKIRESLPEPSSCVSQIGNRIYGGNVTEIREHPSMVLIEYNKGGITNEHHCGGSLINDRYVLTAAHCIIGLPDLWKPTRVRLGEWNTTTNPDCQKYNLGAEICADPHVDVTIEKAIPHEKYVSLSPTQPNDIALLRLSRSIKYSDFIKPICLPIADHLRQATFDGQLMQVSGWGSTQNATRSKVKLQAHVSVLSLSKCQSVYTSPAYNIRNSQICAGGEKGIDSCEGDSGGPLIGFDTSNKGIQHQFIAGVVSFGPTPCGFEGWPGVYTRVGAYIDWILEHMEP
ncbi:serine protease easter-like [Episyrphus balteatus]|uniref:serine protease easter-like n=1 Tax=Episyrphus balteatus TaxID=286459 RepID=UPI002485E87B|nr:serine protease easter-like [Episyrphus balteatus]